MPAVPLHINTDVPRKNGNLKRPDDRGDPSAPHLMTLNTTIITRMRSGSSASTSSSISIDSPGPSSSSASSSSLHLPDSERSSRPLHYPLTSPSTDETVRASSVSEFVHALHDFYPQHQNATCLSFRAGQVIHVLNRDQSGWWDGEIDGQRGWFPSNYVSADERVISLTEEESPCLYVRCYKTNNFFFVILITLSW
jgi:son of sevenless-like protein